MTHTRKTLFGIAIALVALAVVAAVAVGFMVSPTSGPPIAAYSSLRKALLVIDVQEDYTGTTAKSPFPYEDAAGLVSRINRAIARAVQQGYLVIYVRQEFDGVLGALFSAAFSDGTAMKGRPGTEIDRRIDRVTDHVFTKFRGDAFSNPMLDRFLVEHQVGELFLAGLDMDGCVHFTAKGALARGYRVHVVREALGLRAKRKWNKLLDDYQREGITVLSGETW